MVDRHLFLVDEGPSVLYWVVAVDLEDAREKCRQHVRVSCQIDEDESPEDDWSFAQIPDEGMVTLHDDGVPGGTRQMSAREWAMLEPIPVDGVLGCSEY